MHDLIRKFPAHASAKDGRNELVIGEVIRAMARLGHPSILFRIREDRQVLSFRAATHPTITTLHVFIERVAGSTVLTTAMFGNRVSLHVVAEQRLRLDNPAELLRAARIQCGPAWQQGEVRVAQEQSSTMASIRIHLESDPFAQSASNAAGRLAETMASAIETLSNALDAHAAEHAAEHAAAHATEQSTPEDAGA